MLRIYNAFFYSLAGLKRGFRTEPAIRQEMLLLIPAVPLAFWLGRSFLESTLLIGVLLVLLAVELLNTAIEKLCDHVRPERHDDIKFIKDLGSAAVFCMLVLAGSFWAAAAYEKLFGG
jgi:diacylglycerol kinase (ATP)